MHVAPGRTATTPVATSACAADISWCGKTRSLPPPCTSKRLAEPVQRDRRALDVPAGPARPERRVPGRLARPGRPPQQRVERVLLARPVRVAAALGGQREHRSPRPARTRSRTRAAAGRRSRRRRRTSVRRAGLEQPLHQRRRSAGSPRPRRRSASGGSTRSAAMSSRNSAVSRSASARPVLAVARGPLQQRVVDVGDVLHVAHLEPGVAPHPLHQVEGEVRRRVAEVGRVVRRDAADVHPGGRPRARSGGTSPVAVSYSRSGRPRPGSRGTGGRAHDSMAASLTEPGRSDATAGSISATAAQNGGQGIAGQSSGGSG